MGCQLGWIDGQSYANNYHILLNIYLNILY